MFRPDGSSVLVGEDGQSWWLRAVDSVMEWFAEQRRWPFLLGQSYDWDGSGPDRYWERQRRSKNDTRLQSLHRSASMPPVVRIQK